MYIDLEKAKEEFLKYVSNYDESLYNIDLKKWHSIRVMEMSERIAKKMNLSEEDYEIASIIGLLHDIARFEQYTKYQTFNDLNSFDHGDYGVEILNKDLRKYVETDKYDKLIKIAIKNHNKFAIENGLSERELFFSKLIRDADKLDILYEATFMFWNGEEDFINNSTITFEIINTFLNKHQIKHKKDIEINGFDDVINVIAFIFDINFKESFEILKQEDCINKILNRFNLKDTESFNKVKKLSNDYINSHIKKSCQ